MEKVRPLCARTTPVHRHGPRRVICKEIHTNLMSNSNLHFLPDRGSFETVLCNIERRNDPIDGILLLDKYVNIRCMYI
jgi:hypothetical protein